MPQAQKSKFADRFVIKHGKEVIGHFELDLDDCRHEEILIDFDPKTNSYAIGSLDGFDCFGSSHMFSNMATGYSIDYDEPRDSKLVR
jgi:hypothetical protein